MDQVVDQNVMDRLTEMLFALSEGFIQVFPFTNEDTWSSESPSITFRTQLIQNPADAFLAGRIGPEYRWPLLGDWKLIISKSGGKYNYLKTAIDPYNNVYRIDQSTFPVKTIENNLYEGYGSDAYRKMVYMFNVAGGNPPGSL